MDRKKVWFVTGASKGLGLALVKNLLNTGYQVAATSRDASALQLAVGMPSSNFLPLTMDLIDEQSVADAVTKSIATFGKIDVVVNNAGYGQLGTLEELMDTEVRQNFDANVFGMLHVIRHIMPHFRSNNSGYFINISSIAGFLGTFPGWGIYNATKFAVAGLSEAFSAEAASLGIKTTIVYPGYFRTDFLSSGSLRLAETAIPDYKDARALEEIHLNQIMGNQPGDPDKAATVFVQLAEMEQTPLHFFMGSDAVAMAKNKIERLQNELAANEALSQSTDFTK
jgi:NAD(P)-dependent dehydrogenase (short-subunit alcohol dehydrogenase family)